VLYRVYGDAWQMRGLVSDLSADHLEVEECSPTRRTRHIFLQHSSTVRNGSDYILLSVEIIMKVYFSYLYDFGRLFSNFHCGMKNS
jgi:hypothetical protein